jgi:hypothetical protein
MGISVSVSVSVRDQYWKLVSGVVVSVIIDIKG